ncbi:MAG TPA: hypothetical protein PLV85_07370, partial [Polyangiaceae bacterium]|nr:hypothetical protein [Polyangiaceae bacterium]
QEEGMRRTFKRGGIHPPDEKALAANQPIEVMPLPARVLLPVRQNLGAPSEPTVKAKDTVKVGQRIADAGGFVSAPVHASVSGVVKAVDYWPTSVAPRTLCIEIEFDAAARHAEIVWEYRETPDFFSFAQGAIGIQPNGNLFVTDGINRRIFEVTRDKNKIWQMRLPPGTWTYKSITVPRSEFEDW